MVISQSTHVAFVKHCQAAPFVRICVPEISLLWYSFTVASTPEKKNPKLKILFRKYGYFTTKLYQRLNNKQNGPPPTILIDGFYFGPGWAVSALQHDAVLIATGGVQESHRSYLCCISSVKDQYNQKKKKNQQQKKYPSFGVVVTQV